MVLVSEEMAHVLKPTDGSFNLRPSRYPLSCIRLQPVQRCPRGDQQWALGSFLSDVRDTLQSVCGLPARLSNKPCYRTAGVQSAATVQVRTHRDSQPWFNTDISVSVLPWTQVCCGLVVLPLRIRPPDR